MSEEKGGREAPSLDEIEDVLRRVTQSLAWNCHGECRGFHHGKPMKSNDAQELARDLLDRIS